MAQPVIQASFNSGEWAPSLNARVDMQKYHSAAALLENFFVDYRGGASTSPGTKYIIQAYKSATAVRLIPFQASFTVGYVLEFGDFYIRFINNGAPVLEATKTISGATQANPAAIVATAHGYTTGDWVYITGVVGMTQLNGKYYKVVVTGANGFTLTDLNGVAINSTAYTAYSSAGTAARIYTIVSPYAAADLAKIKFAQNVNVLVLCHPSYNPQILTLITATNWTLSVVVIGSTLAAPLSVVSASTLAVGTVNYGYIVTAVDSNGQESSISAVTALANLTDLRTIPGTNTVGWASVPGAQSYNVYKADPVYGAPVNAGAAYGFIGNCTGVSFADSNIALDFSQTPPIAQNPFQGAGVASVTVGTPGTYTAVPTVTIGGAPAGGLTATASAVLHVTGTPTVVSGGAGPNIFNVGDAVNFGNSVVAIVAAIDGSGYVTAFQPITFPGSNPGSIGSGTTPTNPVQQITTYIPALAVTANLVWGVAAVTVLSPGAGYTSPPSVTFSTGAATATAVLTPTSAGNPTVVSFFQQRMVLAAQPNAPQTFYMSQPGSYYNFNISKPIQPDDSIVGSIVAAQLNEIKGMVPVPTGLMMLTSQANWLINGGSAQQAITPADATANAHSFVGSSDLQPIVSNFDVLFVQSKGSFVRDLTFNFYANIFTGTDISVLASHLFYGYTLLEWCWAQEPFKIVWVVRNDGVMLSLTFLKEQEFIGWTHRTTTGLFKSVATVTEAVSFGSVDAVYTVVERVINGNTVKYIERMAERIFPNGAKDAWCVDAGLQYSGAPATSFSGGEHLAGATVTGLADGVVIPPFVMPVSGNFNLPSASKVTIGLAFLPKLQTLAIDTGEPTIQGKMKMIPSVTVRVAETLGLSIGATFATVVPMKDLVVGQVGSASNAVVTDLQTCDAMTNIDARYTVPGQYCITQPFPFPATILGVIPELTVGDTK